MAYYSSPEEMFRKRAENAKRSGDRHWAMAKSGNGDFHYGKAKTFYSKSEENRTKAEKAAAASVAWRK